MEVSMRIHYWASFHGNYTDDFKSTLLKRFQAEGLDSAAMSPVAADCPGICIASEISQELHDVVQSARVAGSNEIIVILGSQVLGDAATAWGLLGSGASDVLVWTDVERV